jgi:superfamily I DNA/RNA helicase
LNKLKSDGQINSTVILHRSHSGIRNIKDFLESNKFEVQELLKMEDIDFESDSIKVCTLSSVKGLEFSNVFIIDLNDDIIPYPPGFNDAEDEFHISTERRLLYTSMTRARERLFLISSGTATRYLAEIDADLLERVGNASSPKIDLNDDLPF